MPTYVALITWTDQGVRNYQDTVDRYEAASKLMESLGARFTDIYWTLGEYDIVSVIDAPDDATVMASLLAASSLGNIRTKTLRALGPDEMREVLSKTAQ